MATGAQKVVDVIPLNDELVVVCAEGGAALFDLSSGEALWEIDCPASCGAVSADGKLLALRSNPDIYLWDLTTGNFLRQLQGHKSDVRCVAFSPDGRMIASGSKAFSRTFASGSKEKTLRLWDVASGRELRQFQGHTSTSSVHSVAFSPDRRKIASGSWDCVWLWDVASGRELQKKFTTIFHKDRNYNSVDFIVYDKCVAFSPDGRTIVFGIKDCVLLWDVASGRELRLLQGHTSTSSVYSVAFSPDSKTIASGSRDRVWLWDVASGRELRQFQRHKYDVYSVAFSPDSRKIASGSRDRVRLWDVASGRELRQLQGYTVRCVAFSPDGRTIASGVTMKACGCGMWRVAENCDYFRDIHLL